ncbi:MAG: hypothetical protein LBT47_05705, partial [Deltaproteobacteria bacterium]|nr:hypothetical protein [Deltaproteobacteria bacterium]
RYPNLLFEMLICCLLIFSALMAKDAHVYSGLKFGNFALSLPRVLGRALYLVAGLNGGESVG